MYEIQLMEPNVAIDELKKQLAKQFTEAQLSILLQKTPKEHIKTRLLNPGKPEGKGNPKLSFVEHAWVENTLNYAFGWDWDWVIEEEDWFGNECKVRGLLVVRSGDKVIKKSGYGGAKLIENNSNMTRADVANSASSRGVKVAASKLGIGLDLYQKETVKIDRYEDTRVTQKDYIAPEREDGERPMSAAQARTITQMGGTVDDTWTSEQAKAEIMKLMDQKRGKK